jgi:formiminoglutamase
VRGRLGSAVQRSFGWLRSQPPGRMAHLIRTDDIEGCAVALLGLPDDLGVKMNGGRPGAAGGPQAFREALSRYGAAHPAGPSWPGVFDSGDVVPGDTLAETHARVTRVAGELLDAGLLPVGIGGGHDLTFPLVRALAQRAAEPLTGLYLDAHLDVRSEEGSGMPFRRLVEDCGVRALHVGGLDPFSNSLEHRRWFANHGGRELGFGPEDPWPEGPLFFSLDLDVLDQAHAPGVSATNPCGWTPPRVEAWVRAAGRNPRVGCFDIMELSPPWDQDDRTARLAARLFLAFLAGVAERSG